MVHLPSVWMRLAVVTVLVGGLSAACDPGPPDVSAEVAALEQYLLTADEVGNGFMLRESGAVRSTGVGHLCPDADVSFDEFVAMRAWFTTASGDDEVSLEQYLWTSGSDTLDALMLDLKKAFANCDGVEWEYFGEKLMIELIDAPQVGDDQIAVRHSGPSTDEVFEIARAYVRKGEVLAIVAVDEHRDSADAPQVIDQTMFNEVVATAVSKLPS